ncbi:MAG: response regulator [Candidatus Dormibacteraceae bacterium]
MRPSWITTNRLEELDLSQSEHHADVVLLIEPDADIAEMYAFGLEQKGFPVEVAQCLGGASGVQTIYRLRPQLIVLDLELPLVMGLEVLYAIRHSTDTANVPVIVLADDSDEYSEAYERGATECHTRYTTTPMLLVGYVSAALGVRDTKAKNL